MTKLEYGDLLILSSNQHKGRVTSVICRIDLFKTGPVSVARSKRLRSVSITTSIGKRVIREQKRFANGLQKIFFFMKPDQIILVIYPIVQGISGLNMTPFTFTDKTVVSKIKNYTEEGFKPLIAWILTK